MGGSGEAARDHGRAEHEPVRPEDTPRADVEADKLELMEQVVSRENMLKALERVESNRGAPGVDGVTVETFRSQLKSDWSQTREQLLCGTYKPQPVKRVEIPKPGGGVRLLGIPALMDRLIQQALLQVLTPIFDPGFSEHSYGFRPERRAHDAIRKAREYVQEGYDWVVDIDLERFFDRVNHDMLMARVARKVKDKEVLRVIRRFLQSGVMVNGVVMNTEEGTPQGGPLSPLLANILLDDLDRELAKRGHRFVRYCDDCNIYVRSQRAGYRVLESVRTFLERKLKLRANEAKAKVDRPTRSKFLGFSMYKYRGQVRIRLAKESLGRLKDRIREMTARRYSQNINARIDRLNEYLRGWLGYFALVDTPSVLTKLDSWIRRRLRMLLWRQWRRMRTRYRELRNLGLPAWKVSQLARTHKGSWRIAGSLNSVLTTDYWKQRGLLSLKNRYHMPRETR